MQGDCRNNKKIEYCTRTRARTRTRTRTRPRTEARTKIRDKKVVKDTTKEDIEDIVEEIIEEEPKASENSESGEKRLYVLLLGFILVRKISYSLLFCFFCH